MIPFIVKDAKPLKVPLSNITTLGKFMLMVVQNTNERTNFNFMAIRMLLTQYSYHM